MRQRERVAANKRAFDEIIGDPFSKEDIVGQYETLRSRGVVQAVDNAKVLEHGGSFSGKSANMAQPNVIDFICDVDQVVLDGLLKYSKTDSVSPLLLGRFWATYFDPHIMLEADKFNQNERAEIEQIIGQLLIARRISPAVKYFTAIRKKRQKDNREKGQE